MLSICPANQITCHAKHLSRGGGSCSAGARERGHLLEPTKILVMPSIRPTRTLVMLSICSCSHAPQDGGNADERFIPRRRQRNEGLRSVATGHAMATSRGRGARTVGIDPHAILAADDSSSLPSLHRGRGAPARGRSVRGPRRTDHVADMSHPESPRANRSGADLQR
jgi:hypothetical protein